MLARPDLEQLRQRVIARFHLEPLNASETAEYLDHRLAVAGLQGPSPFEPRAVKALHAASSGVPRRINLIAARALLAGFAGRARSVSAKLVRQAALEMNWQGEAPARAWLDQAAIRWLLVGLLGVGVGAALAIWLR
jgi:general secretion pathway protein A